MKATIAPNSVKTAKKSIASITRLTRKAKAISFEAYEAKVDANLGRMMDEAMKNFRPANTEEVFKFLGRI